MKRTVLAFALSIGMGLLGLYLVGGRVFDPATYARARLDVPLLAGAAAAACTQWWMPAWRLALLLRNQGIRLPRGTPLLLHLTYTLGSALTPSGSGGGPALATSLRYLGVPWGRGIAVAVQVFVLDITFLAWAAPVAILYLTLLRGVTLPPSLQVLAGSSVALAIVAALLLAVFPRVSVRLILWLGRRRPFRRWRCRSLGIARDYYRAAQLFGRLRPADWVALQIAQVGGWLSSFVVFWALLNLYHPADLLGVAAGLSLASLLSLVMPTPGASGFMEAAVGLGAMSQIDADLVTAPVLLWRLATFYVVFAAGPVASWCLLRQARRT